MRSGQGALPAPIVGFVRNYAVENYWRVAGLCDIDDLCQDGLLIAVRCRNRYGAPGTDLSHPHFMSLVKSSFSRHLIDLVRKHRVRGDTVFIADQGASEIVVLEKHTPAELPLAEFYRYVEEWPERLRCVLRNLIADPATPISRPMRRELRQILCD